MEKEKCVQCFGEEDGKRPPGCINVEGLIILTLILLIWRIQ
jgi:hypothetical protein